MLYHIAFGACSCQKKKEVQLTRFMMILDFVAQAVNLVRMEIISRNPTDDCVVAFLLFRPLHVNKLALVTFLFLLSRPLLGVIWVRFQRRQDCCGFGLLLVMFQYCMGMRLAERIRNVSSWAERSTMGLRLELRTRRNRRRKIPWNTIGIRSHIAPTTKIVKIHLSLAQEISSVASLARASDLSAGGHFKPFFSLFSLRRRRDCIIFHMVGQILRRRLLIDAR